MLRTSGWSRLSCVAVTGVEKVVARRMAKVVKEENHIVNRIRKKKKGMSVLQDR